MASETYELRIPLKKLLIGLLVTVVPICIFGLYSLNQSERSLEATIGQHFRAVAVSRAAEVSQYIHDRVISAGALAADPAVMEAVSAANRAYSGMSEPAIQEKIARIEKSWNTPAAAPLVNEMLGSRASQLFRRYRNLDRRFLRITLTDEKGAAIAASHKTLDYWQADEEFWQAIYAQGRGAVSLTDILYDDVTKSYYVGVGVPVMDEGSGRFLGALDALVDVGAIFPAIHRASSAPSVRTSLVKEDGTVIGAPQVDLTMRLKSDEYEAVRDALSTIGGRQTGYLISNLPAGRSLIAFADTGLKQDYRHLGWVVLVSQPTREAFAPVRMVGRMLAFMIMVGLASVTLLAVYFSLHRRQAYTDIQTAREAKSASA